MGAVGLEIGGGSGRFSRRVKALDCFEQPRAGKVVHGFSRFSRADPDVQWAGEGSSEPLICSSFKPQLALGAVATSAVVMWKPGCPAG